MMVDTMMRLNPVADRTPVTVHFRTAGQSFGFSGSKGVLKATRRASCCVGVLTSVVPFSSSAVVCIFSVNLC